MKIAIVGMGLIGGSLYKAACRAGYDAVGFDRDDQLQLSDADYILLALPLNSIIPWLKAHCHDFKSGAIVVDTCGIKNNICASIAQMMPKALFPKRGGNCSCQDGSAKTPKGSNISNPRLSEAKPGGNKPLQDNDLEEVEPTLMGNRAIPKNNWTFVGGHPMAGKEHSGFAFSDARLFEGASMILTPYPGTTRIIMEKLERFFEDLGFGRVLTTTPEHHDKMIAFTSQLSHVIAASYIQEPLAADAAGYAGGSYANMTRIASMDDAVWEELFSNNKLPLLEILDGFIGRLQSFRNMLNDGDHEAIRQFIRNGARARSADGVKRHQISNDSKDSVAFGKFLKLTVYGASHAPQIGMRLDNFPRDFHVDLNLLQQFLERRAPGRSNTSTARKEDDIPEFLSGVNNGITTGERIEAIIRNKDVRKADYNDIKVIPRPGHADYPQWVKNGRIASGGGANSGRMTAPMCVAGGICLQWLNKRGISIQAKVVEIGGKDTDFENTILEAKKAGDSIGGIIAVEVNGLPAGLGGAMFDGLESELSAAAFGVPGVKGIEFGAGFASTALRGSENNDAFVIQDGRVVTKSNNHGGLLGGMTTGMPLTFRVAMKPTPSIFIEQDSVNLATMENAVCRVHGRHDPCIALRAVPVLEAVTALAIADAILATESATPRICLTLTGKNIQDNLAVLSANRLHIDMAELRVDCLDESERCHAVDFTKNANLPVILTIRRKKDGGEWLDDECTRSKLFEKLLTDAHFDYVDFEEDFHDASLEKLARDNGTRIIRSHHDFERPITDIIAYCRRLKGNSDDIPKLAFKVNSCEELAKVFEGTADFIGFPHIICAMGTFGKASRILAGRTHSFLTFASPTETISKMASIGHLTPSDLVTVYGFRTLTASTKLFAVTGWPLGHSLSPQINNEAFFADGQDAVMVPLPAEKISETITCAETLGIRGIAVTIPHKESIIPLMNCLDDNAREIGAVNTAIHTAAGWKGFNTDVTGFTVALCNFLGLQSLSGHRVAILGAGGAARAIAYALFKLGAAACIFNRTLEKAERLARPYGFKAASLGKESLALLVEYNEIIIQTTSVGLSSKNSTDSTDDPLPFYEFNGSEAVYDLIYSPAETPIMARARKAGCRTENGMTMLIEQAREQRRLYAAEGNL